MKRKVEKSDDYHLQKYKPCNYNPLYDRTRNIDKTTLKTRNNNQYFTYYEQQSLLPETEVENLNMSIFDSSRINRNRQCATIVYFRSHGDVGVRLIEIKHFHLLIKLICVYFLTVENNFQNSNTLFCQ